jgi:X-X-X-Leu-X-X-Gly heptad repeat protein
VETTTIKDGLTRARKKAQQYVSKVDELNQLKKLGIETGEM